MNFKQALVDRVTSDQKKYGFKGKYVSAGGIIIPVGEYLDDGIMTPDGAVFHFAAISPIFPITGEDAQKIKERESNIITGPKLIVPKGIN